MVAARFELAAGRLSIVCSASELRHLEHWLRSLDLNQTRRGQGPASCRLDDSARCLVGAAGLEPASRANPALAAYKTAALPLSYAPKGNCGGRSRTFNLSVQSRAPCRFGYSARVFGRGRGSRTLRCKRLMRPLSRSCSYARICCWRLVVDSHHSLRLFRPTLELSQLPSRKSFGGWSRICTGHRTFMRRLLCSLSYPAFSIFWSGREDTYILEGAPRARASHVLPG